MFGNLAALSSCASPFISCFQLLLVISNFQLIRQSIPLSCICIIYTRPLGRFRAKPSLHSLFDKDNAALAFCIVLQQRETKRLRSDLLLMVVLVFCFPQKCSSQMCSVVLFLTFQAVARLYCSWHEGCSHVYSYSRK